MSSRRQRHRTRDSSQNESYEWSEWEWLEREYRYCRWRINSKGRRVNDYHYPELPSTETNDAAPRYDSTSSTVLSSATEVIQEDVEYYENSEFEYQSKAQGSARINDLAEDVSDLSIRDSGSSPTSSRTVYNVREGKQTGHTFLPEFENASFLKPDFGSTRSWQATTPANDTSSRSGQRIPVASTTPNAWEDSAASSRPQYPGPSYYRNQYGQIDDKIDTQDGSIDSVYSSSATVIPLGSNSGDTQNSSFASSGPTLGWSQERVSERQYPPPESHFESRDTQEDTSTSFDTNRGWSQERVSERRYPLPESYTEGQDYQQKDRLQPAKGHLYLDESDTYCDEEEAQSFDNRDRSDDGDGDGDDSDDTSKPKRRQIIDGPTKPPQPQPGCGAGPRRMAGGPAPRPPPAGSSRSRNTTHRTRDSESSGTQKRKSHSGRKRSVGVQEMLEASESRDVDPEARKQLEQWLAEYVTWKDVTCACGFGYYTMQGEWIAGIDVRAGRAPPRPETSFLGMLEV
ncbi:uncharacterized protein PAC_19664 [Phialocephala subalpina]|uniref:Uncharacterized protein n=1 Tax=Phialocephala subalpina TaxID=576137 RepID=A0A1L7XXJ2_9HELO|nr:uncharacterized protein PAC_19664 [Phialocephala subalpina]